MSVHIVLIDRNDIMTLIFVFLLDDLFDFDFLFGTEVGIRIGTSSGGGGKYDAVSMVEFLL